MRMAAKVLLILGAVLLVIGIIGFAVGIDNAVEAGEDWDKFEFENSTNGTITIEDNDGLGDSGITFWVKGVYVDEDENDIWDVCDNTQVTITEKPEYNSSWEWADLTEGGFYYEVIPFKEGCNVSEQNQDFSREDAGLVKIGRACYACYAGNISFESNQGVWVTYEDKIGEDMRDDLAGIIFGFIGGSGSFCCGIIFLIIGGILAFSKGDENQIIYTTPQGMQMVQPQLIQQTPGPVPVQTGMSQPVFDEAGKGGL